MVIGHVSGIPKFFRGFIYLFHMAVFFMASGYFYSSEYAKNIQSLGNYVCKRVRGLWVPYVVCNTIFALCNNFFLRIHIYDSNAIEYWTFGYTLKVILKGFIFHGGTQLGGSTWFLRTLFEIAVGYVCIDFFERVFGEKAGIAAISDFRHFLTIGLVSFRYKSDALWI